MVWSQPCESTFPPPFLRVCLQIRTCVCSFFHIIWVVFDREYLSSFVQVRHLSRFGLSIGESGLNFQMLTNLAGPAVPARVQIILNKL